MHISKGPTHTGTRSAHAHGARGHLYGQRHGDQICAQTKTGQRSVILTRVCESRMLAIKIKSYLVHGKSTKNEMRIDHGWANRVFMSLPRRGR